MSGAGRPVARSSLGCRLLGVTASAVAVLGLAPVAAEAARCAPHDRGASAVRVTWGTATGEEVGDRPPGLPSGPLADATYDLDTPLVVRTPSGAAGSRTPQLCAGTRRFATLPPLRRGERVVGASANGARIVWRTARTETAGRIAVGRIRDGRVVRVRAVRTVGTGRLRSRDGRIVVTARGDVAWALSSGPERRERTGLWVWLTGRRPRRVTVPAGHGSIATMLLADDQHVFIDDRPEPLTFAPPRPGRCARLATGRWLPVGALRVARIAGFTLGDEETENVGRLLVCDPATGRLSRVETERNDGLRYCGTRLTFERAAVSGPWLLLERHRRQDGAACFGEEYRTTIVDTRTGSVETAAGGLSGPGVHAPEPDRSSGPPPSPEGLDASGAWPAVVLAPGVLAWAAGGEAPSAGSSRHPVVLADAAGTRRVGTATAASLGIDSGLRWTEDGVPRTAALAPAAGWAPAIASLEGL